jgi:ankyrin repeat protein
LNIGPFGHTPLSLAAAKGRTAVLEVLLQSRAQVDSSDSEGRTPIGWAARHGHEAAALLLYERGARIVCQG